MTGCPIDQLKIRNMAIYQIGWFQMWSPVENCVELRNIGVQRRGTNKVRRAGQKAKFTPSSHSGNTRIQYMLHAKISLQIAAVEPDQLYQCEDVHLFCNSKFGSTDTLITSHPSWFNFGSRLIIEVRISTAIAAKKTFRVKKLRHEFFCLSSLSPEYYFWSVFEPPQNLCEQY